MLTEMLFRKIIPMHDRPYKGRIVIDDTLKAAIDAYYAQYGAQA